MGVYKDNTLNVQLVLDDDTFEELERMAVKLDPFTQEPLGYNKVVAAIVELAALKNRMARLGVNNGKAEEA